MTREQVIGGGTGVLLFATMVLVAAFEWTGIHGFSAAAMATTVLALGLLALRVTWARRLFLVIGLFLFVLAVARLPDWTQATGAALRSAGFIIAFFTAMTTIRSASLTSEPIADCGRFLADQPPGRRYLALTVGGHLFGLILMYGSISLLGSLAEASATREKNPEIRGHRLRRMLIAIQRGFVSTLPWSPLAFATAISISLVPGANWTETVLPCFVSTVILAGVGWALDTVLKPKISGPLPARTAPDGRWISKLRPLLMLLFILVGSTLALHLLTGVRVTGVVMVVVPALSLAWVALQAGQQGGSGAAGPVLTRAKAHVVSDLPRHGPEIVLLAMAGFIGALGSSIVLPMVHAAGFNLAGMPAWVLLLAVFWLIPITGQFGMNPILSASLMVPLLPAPEVIGVSPSAVILAITSGWALSGATSPFTASTLLIAVLGKVTPGHVGMRWNGPYAVVCGLVLSVWICIAAAVL